MFDIGFKEILIIAVVLLVLFGSRKIPTLAQNIVEAVRTLRKGFTDDASSGKKK